MARMTGLSGLIRDVAREKYVLPAIEAGKGAFSIRVKDLMEDVRQRGVSPEGRAPAFCTSIQTGAFLERDGLSIDAVDGPAKKLSTTVVVHYRRAGGGGDAGPRKTDVETEEDRVQRVMRLADSLSGLMRDEIQARGGTEGFMRWVRSDDEDEAV